MIERGAVAHGGLDILAKYPAARIKVKGSYVFQGRPVPYSGQSVYSMPDRLHSTVELTIQNVARTVEQIQNGERSGMLVAGIAQHVSDAQSQELKMSLYCQNVARLVPLLKDEKFNLSTAGDKSIDGKSAIGVRVAYPGRKEVHSISMLTLTSWLCSNVPVSMPPAQSGPARVLFGFSQCQRPQIRRKDA